MHLGPWDMVLIIHGFPNEISALRFEWAWQNPEKSLRLKHLVPKTKQYNFQFKFSIVCEMLRIGPWCRLPLTIRWLKQEYKRDFPLSKLPPTHMPIVYGLVELVKKKKAKNQNQEIQQIFDPNDKCYICKIEINQDEILIKNLNGLKCLSCSCITHTTCLANLFIEQNSFKDGLQLLPIEGDCPKCKVHLMWGDLTKFRLGNFKLNNWDANADEADDDNEDEEDEEEDFVERDVESD